MQEISDVGSSRLADGFDSLCYISRSDNSLVDLSCSDLLRDMQGGFTDSTALTAAGGRYGCYTARNGLSDPQRQTACQAGRETSGALSDCATCTHMFVCVDYPGEQSCPITPS